MLWPSAPGQLPAHRPAPTGSAASRTRRRRVQSDAVQAHMTSWMLTAASPPVHTPSSWSSRRDLAWSRAAPRPLQARREGLTARFSRSCGEGASMRSPVPPAGEGAATVRDHQGAASTSSFPASGRCAGSPSRRVVRRESRGGGAIYSSNGAESRERGRVGSDGGSRRSLSILGPQDVQRRSGSQAH